MEELVLDLRLENTTTPPLVICAVLILASLDSVVRQSHEPWTFLGNVISLGMTS
jgi:hypothetical protein